MSLQLFYAPDLTPPDYTLGEEESKHCIRVLRLGAGGELHLTDGRGGLFRCRIVEADARRCRVEVVETFPEHGRLPYRLVMGVAPTKNTDRFEWFLEKATEIGVTEIVPLLCAHGERRTLNVERSGRVITAAMKQSLKAYHPLLHEITPFAEVVSRPFEGQRFIAHCGEARSAEGKVFLPRAWQADRQASEASDPSGVMILIGPEGDFSPAEVELALQHGFREITLGDQRLRTETAAVVATVMVAAANG